MTKLSDMLAEKQKAIGATDSQICRDYGWMQQTFSTWKRGTVPRSNMHEAVSRFLGISVKELERIIAESSTDTETTNLSSFRTSREYGKVSDRKDGKFKFLPVNAGRKAIPEGRYSIQVDTKVMEPALPVGTKAWLDPTVWPKPGQEVMAFGKGGVAWLGRLASVENGRAELERHAADPVTVSDVQAVHVVVLSERV